MAYSRSRAEQDHRNALKWYGVVTWFQRVVFSFDLATLESKCSVACGQRAACEPEQSGPIRVGNSGRVKAEAPFQHGAVRRPVPGGRKSSMP